MTTLSHIDPATAAPATALSIVMVPVADLKPYEQNARKHSKRNIDAIRASIREFGFRKPLVIWQDNLVLAGHGALEAAKAENLTDLPCADASHLPFAKARAYVIADNKASDLAGWHDEILKSELEALRDEADMDADLDLSALGFSDRELIKYIDDLDLTPERRKAATARATSAAAQDPEAAAKDGPSIVRTGDLWSLGPHKLLCGSATEPANWTRLMAGAQAQLLFTDPPYGVDYSEKQTDLNAHLGRSRNSESIKNDALSGADLETFLTDTLIACDNRGRHARLIELSETYCDRILRRWRLKTGQEPTKDGVPLCDYESETLKGDPA